MGYNGGIITMGGRAGGGGGMAGGAYSKLNRAQKIAVNRALSNEKYNGNTSWTKDSAAADLLKHWDRHKKNMFQANGKPATDMQVMKEITKYMVNHKTGEFFGWK